MNTHVPVEVHFRHEVTGRLDQHRSPKRTLLSDDLFRGTREIEIDHRGAVYRLKITRQGKLILNK